MRTHYQPAAAAGRAKRSLLRVGVVTAIATVVVLAIAGPASAHVKVSGIDVTQGGYGVITFRVPTESAKASTTELAITFPASTPFLSVDTQPKAGWTATVTSAKLAKPVKTADGETSSYVSKVVWKADSLADAIPPGEFDMFNISAGPLPNTASVALPALQYYSDGTTVNWNERSANGAVPAHPAPILELAASSTAAPSAGPNATHGASASSSSAAAHGPDGYGIAGLIAGILALVIALIALFRSRRNRTTTD